MRSDLPQKKPLKVLGNELDSDESSNRRRTLPFDSQRTRGQRLARARAVAKRGGFAGTGIAPFHLQETLNRNLKAKNRKKIPLPGQSAQWGRVALLERSGEWPFPGDADFLQPAPPERLFEESKFKFQKAFSKSSGNYLDISGPAGEYPSDRTSQWQELFLQKPSWHSSFPEQNVEALFKKPIRADKNLDCLEQNLLRKSVREHPKDANSKRFRKEALKRVKASERPASLRRNGNPDGDAESTQKRKTRKAKLIQEFDSEEAPGERPAEFTNFEPRICEEPASRIGFDRNFSSEKLTGQRGYQRGFPETFRHNFKEEKDFPGEGRSEYLVLLHKWHQKISLYNALETQVLDYQEQMEFLEQEIRSILKWLSWFKESNSNYSEKSFKSTDAFGRDRELVMNFNIKINLAGKDVVDSQIEQIRASLWGNMKGCNGSCALKAANAQPSFMNKSGRVPYMLGDNGHYVLVKFLREKKRDKVRNFDAAKKTFGALWVVLRKVLWNEWTAQSDLDALGDRDRKIMTAVLMKKKLVKKRGDVEFSETVFNEVARRSGQKRNEENLKCIFKYTQKFLRTQFRKTHEDFSFRKKDKNMKQKNLVDLGFYTFYFGKIADRLDWPISKFFHPKVFSGGKASAGFSLECPDQRPKTINREYIDNLKRSREFMEDMRRFLHNEFELNGRQTGILDQYREISEEKMMQKLDQWHRLIQQHGEKPGLARILEDLGHNDKCKLPWSIKEIDQAVKDTCRQFSITKEKILQS